MKRYSVLFLSILVFTFFGCHRKKPQKSVEQPVAAKPVETNDPYVPFTKDFYAKLKAYGIDVKKVQFFVDQQLVLTRYVDQSRAEVKSGVVKFLNGKYVNEIVIPQYTPCVVDSIDFDGFRVSFESGSNNHFKFINNRYSPDYFIFSGTNWKDGTADVYYDNQIYRVNCGTCSSAADAKLVVKQSDIDKTEKKTKVLQGRRVDN
ncbi:MAG: hypothetical protein KGO81_07410 [Bacteroidota bacterium]|nr:hypothetical protein [Bacteroidota bacterium]